jgi:hypothetical protein
MKHPFRVAIENGASKEELKNVFARNVVLYAYMLSKPLHGFENTIKVVCAVAKVASPIVFTLQVSDNRQTFLFWEGHAGGKKFMACTILVDGEDGLTSKMRVVMRSWPITTLFRNAVYKELSSIIPADYWRLDPSQVVKEESREFTSVALQKIPLAPDFELHSPIMAKSIKGNENVQQALKLAHAVQSRSSYTSIIATPDMIIELFDCDAAGNPMEGLWVSKLNKQGQIDDLTVYLRPYPSVTILRNNAKAWQKKYPNLPLWILISIGNWPLRNDSA